MHAYIHTYIHTYIRRGLNMRSWMLMRVDWFSFRLLMRLPFSLSLSSKTALWLTSKTAMALAIVVIPLSA